MNSVIQYDERFEDIVRAKVLEYVTHGRRRLDDDLCKISRRVQEHFSKVEGVARGQWGTGWLAENAMKHIYLTGASLDASGQAAIFIALGYISRPIDELHRASVNLATADSDNQFQLKRARDEHDQAQTKLTAAVDQALDTWSNKRAQ